MKFCRPIYKAIYKVDADLAVKTFKEHAGFYRQSYACAPDRTRDSTVLTLLVILQTPSLPG